jgi:hypothetical protein
MRFRPVLLFFLVGQPVGSAVDRLAITFAVDIDAVVDDTSAARAVVHRHSLTMLLGDRIEDVASAHCSGNSNSNGPHFRCNGTVVADSIRTLFLQHLAEKKQQSQGGNDIPSWLRRVRSFDIFDTIMARDVATPTDIFSLVERDYPFPHFRESRIHAEAQSDGTFDGIYRQLQLLRNLTDRETHRLQAYELACEMNHTYLIQETYGRVQDGDILVSDMYLPHVHVLRLLEHAGFRRDVNLYVTSGGKHFGWMWQRLNVLYDIEQHVGDNYWSDVAQAYEHGIPAEWATVHAFTPLESTVWGAGYPSLALCLRRFRHSNPHPPRTVPYHVFADQARYNVPVLLLLVAHIKDIMVREGLTRLLLTTRDGCNLEKLFHRLGPDVFGPRGANVTVLRFHSSRVANHRRQVEYATYVREMYEPGRTLIFDMHGCFISARALFLDLFGVLPRVHLFSGDMKYYPTHGYPGISYSVVDRYELELLNLDVVGQLVSVFHDENTATRRFVRAPLNWYPRDVAEGMHHAVETLLADASRRAEVVAALRALEGADFPALFNATVAHVPTWFDTLDAVKINRATLGGSEVLGAGLGSAWDFSGEGGHAELLGAELEYLYVDDDDDDDGGGDAAVRSGPPWDILLVDGSASTDGTAAVAVAVTGVTTVGSGAAGTEIAAASGDSSQASLAVQALQDYFGAHNVHITVASAAVQVPFPHDVILHRVACDDLAGLAASLPLLWAAMKPRSVHALTLARGAPRTGCTLSPTTASTHVALPPRTRLKCCPDRVGAQCTQDSQTADAALDALFSRRLHTCFAWKD